MAVYIGESCIARTAKKLYIGVGGLAHEVTKMYTSVNGVAKLIWPNSLTVPDSISTISFSNLRNNRVVSIRTSEGNKWEILAFYAHGGNGGDVGMASYIPYSNIFAPGYRISEVSMSSVLKTYLQSIGESFSLSFLFRTILYYESGFTHITYVTARVVMTISGNGISIDDIVCLTNTGKGAIYNPQTTYPNAFTVDYQHGDILF